MKDLKNKLINTLFDKIEHDFIVNNTATIDTIIRDKIRNKIDGQLEYRLFKCVYVELSNNLYNQMKGYEWPCQ